MALIICPECGHQVSDKAASCPKCGAPIAAVSSSDVSTSDAATPPSAASKKKSSGIWKFIIGVPVGLFVIVMIIGTMVSNTPEGQDRSKRRLAIEYCWADQAKKSYDPNVARFIAGACEKLEADFRAKYGYGP